MCFLLTLFPTQTLQQTYRQLLWFVFDVCVASSSLEDDEWCGPSKKSGGYLIADGLFVRLTLASASTASLLDILEIGSGAVPGDVLYVEQLFI